MFAILLLTSSLMGCGSNKANVATEVSEASEAEKKVEEKSTEEVSEELLGESEITEENEGDEDNASLKITDNRKRNTVTEADNGDGSTQVKTATVNDSDFEVKEYLYTNSIGSSIDYIIVKSNAEVPVKVNGNAVAKDADGNSIGAGTMSIDVIGPGETSIGYFYFDSVSDIDSVEYQLNYDTDTSYYPVISNLDVEQAWNDKNVTVTVTNNGSEPAQFVQAYALFFDVDGNVLRTSYKYVTDDDSEIKPDATLSVQLDCYKGNYDHAEVYLTGRASSSSSFRKKSKEINVTDDQFEITQYKYISSSSSTYYVAVKNNSSETVKITSNGTAKDADGNTLGAGQMTIDVLAPGETSIGYFHFSSVPDFDKVEYSLKYSEPSYSSIIDDLSVGASLNAKNAIVTVTNNGSKAGKFVQGYVLFLASDDSVIKVDTAYFTDDDSEIKSGASISKQFNCRKEFDHVEIYLTGRSS